jgi:hypothetical protein
VRDYKGVVACAVKDSWCLLASDVKRKDGLGAELYAVVLDWLTVRIEDLDRHLFACKAASQQAKQAFS